MNQFHVTYLDRSMFSLHLPGIHWLHLHWRKCCSWLAVTPEPLLRLWRKLLMWTVAHRFHTTTRLSKNISLMKRLPSLHKHN